MAVFKAIEKKASAVRKILRKAELIVKHLTKALALLNLLLKSVEILLRLSRRVIILIRKIIRAIQAVLKRAGKFAGPLKVLIKPLRVILGVLQKGLAQFQRIIAKLRETVQLIKLVFQYNGGARSLKKALGKLLEKIRKKAEEVEELAKLLEKQQKWLEKILPPAFIKKLWDLVNAITKPLNDIKKLTEKIIQALLAFIKKLIGLQKVVDDLKDQFKFLNKWLQEIEVVTDTINWIVKEIENFLKKIPGIGFIINILELIGRFVDWLIKKTGVEALLKWILDKSGIIDAITKGLNQVIGAIKELIGDFEKIIDDILKLFGDLNNLFGILTNLSGLLRMIALLKWFFGFRIPNRLKELELGLQLLTNPNMQVPFLSSQNSVTIAVDTITIKGKGIGSDWSFNFMIGEESEEITIARKGNRITKVHSTISEQVVSNRQEFITNELKVVAVENDPFFDDFGMTTNVIQIENKAQETQQQLEFTVDARGGDAGATATIIVQLSIVVEATEDVLIPLSELGRENTAINYMEHALHNLKADIGNFTIAPGLLAQQAALHNFVSTAENLLYSLKDGIVHNNDITNTLEEFSVFIAESHQNLVPKEELDFEPSYFVALFENSKIVPETDLAFELFNTDDFIIEEDTEDIFDTEDLCKPVLTTDIADRPFDLDDTFDIADFIKIDDENPLR